MTAPLSAWSRLWLCEAIRLREAHGGPFADQAVNRKARLATTLGERIETRAQLLAEREGLLPALDALRQAGGLSALLLLVLALSSGVALAWTALGDGRAPVNLLLALAVLLGLNSLSLLLWLVSLLLNKSLPAPVVRLGLWLSQRMAHQAHSALLLPALLSMLRRARLNRVLLGAALHLWWLLLLVSAWFSLLLLFSAKRYEFIWESTLLAEHSFIGLSHWLGAPLRIWGLSTPELTSLNSEAIRQAWASWLLGVFALYALLPRALLAFGCLLIWRQRRKHLALDLQLPDYQLLAEQLQPSHESLGIIDPAPAALTQHPREAPQRAGQGLWLVGLEVDPQRAWPPALPADIHYAGLLDSRAQRQVCLDQLAAQPAQRLLIAIDPLRSADRGTLALLAELASLAEHCRIWLLEDETALASSAERRSHWLEALAQLNLDVQQKMNWRWLEQGHD